MNLVDFIEKFILPNTIVRVWMPDSQGYKLIFGPITEWEILKSGCFERDDSIFEVVGVTDIMCCDEYQEAVNVVVKVKGGM